ncbi:MAG: hypothetical protein GX198_08360 [Epulopiscium sp.]|nr:hypothetical protein [Candidatus Epulonipiscium sp.]
MAKEYEANNENYKGIEESFRQQPMMNNKPYPSNMYPMGVYPNGMMYYDDIDERDMEYMKRMYPELNQRIQKHIEYECDKMDYDGSPIYNEYPDQEIIEQMIDRVYERIIQEMPDLLDEGEMERQRIPRYRLVRSLAGALLLTELFGRRRRYRRRIPFYGYPSYQYPYYQYPYQYSYPYPYY